MQQRLKIITWKLCLDRFHLHGILSKREVKRIEWRIKKALTVKVRAKGVDYEEILRFPRS